MKIGLAWKDGMRDILNKTEEKKEMMTEQPARQQIDQPKTKEITRYEYDKTEVEEIDPREEVVIKNAEIYLIEIYQELMKKN
jgi:hypothetical protein